MGVVVESHIDEAISAKNEGVRRALEAIGAKCHGYATMLAPVDTGLLRASLDWEVEGDFAIIGDTVEYAPYVEFGTRKMAAQPFLKPAVADHTAEYKAIAESCLHGS